MLSYGFPLGCSLKAVPALRKFPTKREGTLAHTSKIGSRLSVAAKAPFLLTKFSGMEIRATKIMLARVRHMKHFMKQHELDDISGNRSSVEERTEGDCLGNGIVAAEPSASLPARPAKARPPEATFEVDAIQPGEELP